MINWHDRCAKVLQREPEFFDAARTVLEVARDAGRSQGGTNAGRHVTPPSSGGSA